MVYYALLKQIFFFKFLVS